MTGISTQELILLLIPTAIAIAAIVIAVITRIRYGRLYRAYDTFMRGRDTETLEDFIMEEKDEIIQLQESDAATKEAIRTMNRRIRASFQKTGIVRYDAFLGMGGKMSFALALLDYTNSGMILNCMHSREGCFLYIKSVDAGTTDTPLGTEEKEALERALGYIKD